MMDKRMCAALLVGVLFGCIIGFVLGWSWSERPSALSDVRVLDVLVAIGSIGAALGAAYAAHVALSISKKEVERANEEKEKYVMAQTQVLSEWGNRVIPSLIDLKCKLSKIKDFPNLWCENDINAVEKNLSNLNPRELNLQLKRIHIFPNGEAWAFCIGRAVSLHQELKERFESKKMEIEGDLSDIILREKIDELLGVLEQISVLTLWYEYDDSI